MTALRAAAEPPCRSGAARRGAQLAAALFLAGVGPASAFDSYSVHLRPATMSERCTPQLSSPISNFTYRFRGYPQGGITLHDGTYTERYEAGGIEWAVSIAQQDRIDLAGAPARLLLLFFDHIGGSGSASQVMVVRCRHGHLQVVFEAGGEGLGGTYSAEKGLWVGHPVWRGNDSHASPSGGIDEIYRWQRERDMFARAWRSEW